MFTWLTDILNYFGFYKKSGKLILLGLDNAGKTTLLSMLKDNKLIQSKPTLHPTSEQLSLGNIELTTFDLGGHHVVRKVWKQYMVIADAIVFIVDVSNIKRLAESKEELDSLLTEEQCMDCPILLLGNKIDRYDAVSEQEIRNYFQLNGVTTGKGKISRSVLNGRPIELFMCSIKNREGYGEGLRWLSQYF